MEAHIVVIDNDQDMRELFAFCLNNAGWEVFAYDYAHIGLTALIQLHPDLIILDFNKEDGGTGWEFLQLLKMEDTTANIPMLIVTTASPLSAEIQGYLLARHIHIINKPFDIDVFLPLVQKTLNLASPLGSTFSSDRSLPILLVEDTKALRETLETVLRLEGYQVLTAENGLLALEALYTTECCLILLDISMPIMDGLEFLSTYSQQLKSHAPVIVLSGQQDILTQDLPFFVVDVLSKPFEVRQLLGLVQKFAQPV